MKKVIKRGPGRPPAVKPETVKTVKAEVVQAELVPMKTVNHPKHYNMGKIEVIDAIEEWHLNFNRGNAVKYIARAGHKSQNHVEDLQKAVWYLQRELKRLKDV